MKNTREYFEISIVRGTHFAFVVIISTNERTTAAVLRKCHRTTCRRMQLVVRLQNDRDSDAYLHVLI